MDQSQPKPERTPHRAPTDRGQAGRPERQQAATPRPSSGWTHQEWVIGGISAMLMCLLLGLACWQVGQAPGVSSSQPDHPVIGDPAVVNNLDPAPAGREDPVPLDTDLHRAAAPIPADPTTRPPMAS